MTNFYNSNLCWPQTSQVLLTFFYFPAANLPPAFPSPIIPHCHLLIQTLHHVRSIVHVLIKGRVMFGKIKPRRKKPSHHSAATLRENGRGRGGQEQGVSGRQVTHLNLGIITVKRKHSWKLPSPGKANVSSRSSHLVRQRRYKP